MSEHEKKEIPVKVDGEKRDFLRKLALGTAYAVPVMATFSLDSVRNSAHAQGIYTRARVLGFGFGGGGSLRYGNPSGPPSRAAFGTTIGYYVIKFSKAMDQSAGTVACTPGSCRPGGDDEIDFNGEIDLSYKAVAVDCNTGWIWTSPTTLAFPVTCEQGGPTAMSIQLSGFLDADGLPLTGPTAHSADLCSNPAHWDYFLTTCLVQNGTIGQ